MPSNRILSSVYLKSVKEVLPDDDDSLAPSGPALGRRQGLDLRHQGVRVQAGKVWGGRLSICTWPGLVVELTFCAVDSPDLPAVFAVVVDEHVLADTQEGGGVHLGRGRVSMATIQIIKKIIVVMILMQLKESW